jgi:uncharacterized MAPEG superfamily protein
MNFELQMLLWAVLIPLAMVTAQGSLLVSGLGMAPVLGNREQFAPPQGWRGRWVRAHANQLENLLPFGLAVLAAHAAEVSNQATRVACAVFVGARLLHAVSYVAGILYLRTAAFYAGVACIYVLLVEML